MEYSIMITASDNLNSPVSDSATFKISNTAPIVNPQN
jgi:hypothetical protein